jgi:hypothetical protein
MGRRAYDGLKNAQKQSIPEKQKIICVMLPALLPPGWLE